MPGTEAARQYRLYAQHCLEIAAALTNLKERVKLIDLAKAWANLANQAEKNGRLDLVYETPEHRRRINSQDSPLRDREQIDVRHAQAKRTCSAAPSMAGSHRLRKYPEPTIVLITWRRSPPKRS